GQQVSVRAATTLATRFATAFGEPLVQPDLSTREKEVSDRLMLFTPTVERVAQAKVAQIAAIGIPQARARAIHGLAQAVVSKGLRLSPALDVEEQIRDLTALSGIGEWTAQYIAMRALAWPDAFPHTDLGVRHALEKRGTAKSPLAVAEAWRPWRSYATLHLWKSVEESK